jgi:N6-L-threonylcarbamoyladenine synthase
LNSSHLTILGIESSCDDTAAAVLVNGKIRANIVASQDVHRQYGGVVPELASRAHQSHIVPVVEEACKTAGIRPEQIDAIAYTRGPGLMGSLLVGASFAKGLSIALNKPTLGVNHLEAHVAAIFIENPDAPLPFLCLLVSGGHTQLVLVRSPTDMEIVGSTLDDAAGEALDKGAKMLGLPYPGGPVIDRLAREGNREAYAFSDAHVPGLDFSFSGIKTSLLYFLRDKGKAEPGFAEAHLADICASYQEHVVRYLLRIAAQAIRQYKPKAIALSGGVSANSRLRNLFTELGQKENLPALIPSFPYCTDNAAMIAMAGYFMAQEGGFTALDALPFARGGK